MLLRQFRRRARRRLAMPPSSAAQPGEFKADRNNIPRVWMDHGAWPLLTDQAVYRPERRSGFPAARANLLQGPASSTAAAADDLPGDLNRARSCKTADGEVVSAARVLEHLLVQHLTAFFNVGEHNILLLEGADWNDALDMARTRGESVAFSALYAGNLQTLAELVPGAGR